MSMNRTWVAGGLAVATLWAASGTGMGALIDPNQVTYTYDVPLNANTANRQNSTGDEMADGVATSGGAAHDDPNMVYWLSAAPQDDPVWSGPKPMATFDLGGLYSDLASIQMWYGGWDAAGIGGPHGINVSFSSDNVTYSPQVLYNSAPEGYPSNLSFTYHTATEPIAYQDLGGFRYVKIEFQPINNGSTQANILAMGEVTFDGTVIPEPASLALISLGGLMMLRRRHA